MGMYGSLNTPITAVGVSGVVVTEVGSSGVVVSGSGVVISESSSLSTGGARRRHNISRSSSLDGAPALMAWVRARLAARLCA
eukprot:scaffold120527_cov24-Attheya_sp.AAC.1